MISWLFPVREEEGKYLLDGLERAKLLVLGVHVLPNLINIFHVLALSQMSQNPRELERKPSNEKPSSTTLLTIF